MFKSGKSGIKQKYKLTFVSANGLDGAVSEGSLLLIDWKRGSKKENKGVTASKPLNKSGGVEWNETITVLCTLFKDGVIYGALFVCCVVLHKLFQMPRIWLFRSKKTSTRRKAMPYARQQ